MTNGPPASTADAPPLWQMWRDLAEQQARTSQSVADQGARLAALERSVPELAARLDGRFTSVEAQIARQADHLGQQDSAAERTRLEQKSQLGTLQQQLGALQQAEQQRMDEARRAEQLRSAQAVALAEEARLRHRQAASRLRQTVAGVASFAAGQVAAELAGWPLRWRLFALAGGAALALAWVLLDYLWTRPRRRTRTP
jgi:DNA-binding helix-hairpin-helix protein with protein kinase domain